MTRSEAFPGFYDPLEQPIDVDDASVAGNLLVKGGYPVIDAQTFDARFDGASDDSAALLAAAQKAHSIGGAIVRCPQGVSKISSLALTGLSGVRFVGLGRAQTAIVFTTTTGTVIDLTNSQFCGFEDMLLRPFTTAAAKTAGELFKLNASGGSSQQNRFSGLNLASCYRAFNLVATGSNLFDDILMQDFSTSHLWHSLFHLSGAAIGNHFTRIRGGSGSNSGTIMLADGAGVDSTTCSDWELASQPGSSLAGMVLANGEWFRLNNIGIESGVNAIAFRTEGPVKGIDLTNFHLLGYNGISIAGGKGIRIASGEVLACQREGIVAAAFSAIKHLKLRGIHVSDCGLAANNTYDGIYITAAVNDFSIADCTSDDAAMLGSVPRVRYGCNIDVANDRYTVRGNHFYGATGKLNNPAGTGATRVVDGNI